MNDLKPSEGMQLEDIAILLRNVIKRAPLQDGPNDAEWDLDELSQAVKGIIDLAVEETIRRYFPRGEPVPKYNHIMVPCTVDSDTPETMELQRRIHATYGDRTPEGRLTRLELQREWDRTCQLKPEGETHGD